MSEEHVLVVPTQTFRDLGYFEGFCDRVSDYLPVLLDSANTSYQPRSKMEADPSFKQLIPYVVFRHVDEAGVPRYFHYTRGSGQGEQRLHAKRSVGVGGHISLVDAAHPDAYQAGARRELAEEIEFHDAGGSDREAADPSGGLGSVVGLINDDSNEVGRVHLGVVHVVDLVEPWIRAREKDLLEANFSDSGRLLEWFDQFETWSQIALRHLLGLPS